MKSMNPRAFRAIVWKEWRENAKWALLSAAALMLAMLMMGVTRTNNDSGGFLGYSVKPFDDFWTTIDNVIALGSMLTAALLGFVQILPERRRDQWAFLMHRPSSRTVLFWCKACAGLTLHLLATAVPLIAVSIWASIPGNMAAPFDARLMLAGAASIVCGAIVYFSVLTVATRSARWFGSRALPLVTGCLLAFVIYAASIEFWRAMALCAIAIAAMAFVAARSFAASDDEGRRTIAGRAALALTLWIGWTTICTTVFLIAVSVLSAMHPRYTPHVHYQYGVLASGRIVKVAFSPGTDHTDRAREIRDLSGRQLPVSGADVIYPYALILGWSGNQGPSTPFVSPERYVQTLGGAQRRSPEEEAWFYLRGSRRISVYSTVTHRQTGEIGANGWGDAGSGRPFPFLGDLVTAPVAYSLGDDLYVFQRQIYHVNTAGAYNGIIVSRRREITPVLRVPLNDDILSVMTLYPDSNAPDNRRYLVSTLNNVRIFGAMGDLLFVVPVTPQTNVQVNLISESRGANHSSRTGERYVFWNAPPPVGVGVLQTQLVTEYSATGQVLMRTTLSSLPASAPSNDGDARIYIALIPTFALLLGAMHALDSSITSLTLVAITFAAIWAALGWLTLRRAGLCVRRRIAAAIAAGLFGLPMFLTLLSLYRWPALVPCANCRKKRLVTNELCEHCGAAFKEPPLDGTEIFEAPGLILHTEAA